MRECDLLGNLGEGEAGKQAWIGRREKAWEATVVRRIVKSLNCCTINHVLCAADELTGERSLTCEALARAIPDLPVQFATRRMPGHRFLSDLKYLNSPSFQNSLLYEAYQQELS